MRRGNIENQTRVSGQKFDINANIRVWGLGCLGGFFSDWRFG